MAQQETQHQEQGSIYEQLATPLPHWAREYMLQRERALLTELHQIRKMLGKPQLEKVRTRPR